MARRVSRPATYEDLLAVPEPLVAELIDGEIIASPRPGVFHALASSALGGQLMNPFQWGRGGPGGWWLLDEPELHLARDVLVPDLAGWRRSRMQAVPRTAFIELPPDWVCEVISPSTARTDRARKLPIYARDGVGFAWLLDPDARTVEVLRLEGDRWLMLAVAEGEDRVRLAPFEELELELAALWGEDLPAAPRP